MIIVSQWIVLALGEAWLFCGTTVWTFQLILTLLGILVPRSGFLILIDYA